MLNITTKRKTAESKVLEGGFSMIEMLVALFMSGIVLTAAFNVYITQHNHLIVQDDISDLQASARATAELMAQEIRKAGYMLPAIVNAIESANTDPDTVAVRFATPKIAGVVLSTTMTSPYSVLQCTGNSITGLSVGDWMYIYDPESNAGESFIATSIDYENRRIAHGFESFSQNYPAGSELYSIDMVKFYIGQSDQSSPNLMIERLGSNPEIFADNIDDLNLTYHLSNGSIVNQVTNPWDVRMVGIRVTAKSTRPDLNVENNNYRTRSFLLKVKVRNLGLS